MLFLAAQDEIDYSPYFFGYIGVAAALVFASKNLYLRYCP